MSPFQHSNLHVQGQAILHDLNRHGPPDQSGLYLNIILNMDHLNLHGFQVSFIKNNQEAFLLDTLKADVFKAHETGLTGFWNNSNKSLVIVIYHS